jgi:amino acid transporter
VLSQAKEEPDRPRHLVGHVTFETLSHQGISREELPWNHWRTVYSSYFTSVACIYFFVMGGFAAFINGNWEVGTFVSAYLDIPIVLIAYIGSNLLPKKTKILSL